MPFDLSLDESLPAKPGSSKPPSSSTATTSVTTTAGEDLPQPQRPLAAVLTSASTPDPMSAASALSAILQPDRQLRAAMEL